MKILAEYESEESEMWKNCIENAYDHISLHDCIANNISLADNILTLSFHNGFWVMPDSEYNNYKDIVRTGKSQISFIDFDIEMSEIYVFKRHYIFGKHICTTRKEMKLDELINNINKGLWKLEFVEEYHACRRALFFGMVNTKRKNWAFEFQMTIDCEKTEYCWNNICPDKKW